jgi:hypothetical protein
MNPSLTNIEPITLLASEKELPTIKTILKFLNEKHPTFKAMKFRTGKIGEDILVSFKVNEEFYSKVLEKFAYNDIPIIMKDKKANEIIDEKKEQKRRKLKAQGWSEINAKKNQITLAELDKLARGGKLKKITKEAKGGISSNRDIVKKARSLISETVENSITNLINYAIEKPGRREDTIDELLLIATDKDLKLFGKVEEMIKAGIVSIELALSHKNYYDKIILIANNTKINNLINVKATIALASIYNLNENENSEKLTNAVKYLNTRWLKIALESVRSKFTHEEIKIFERFIGIIEEQRKAA